MTARYAHSPSRGRHDALANVVNEAVPRQRASALTWLGTVSLCLSVFSGNFSRIVPGVPVDRACTLLFLIAAIIAAFWKQPRLRPIHAILIAEILWVAASAAAAGTLVESVGFFSMADQVVIPAILFTVAPIAFSSGQDRQLLLKGVAVTCIYVGIVSSAQSLGLTALIFPRYIAQAAIPGEITRAVGPSLQAASNGAMLAMCLAPLLFLVTRVRGLWRVVVIVALAAAIVGAFLSLTRSVWAGAIVAIVAYLLYDPRLRRVGFALLGGLAAVAAGTLALVPSLAAVVSERAETVRSLDDRSTTNIAAIRMFDAHSLFGVGWGRFLDNVDSYVRQQDLVPLTTTHIPAHNIFLSRAAELGFLGVLLLAASLLLGPVASIARSWGTGHRGWSMMLACVFAAWFCVAMLTPMGYTFPNYFLWILAGLLAEGVIAHPGRSSTPNRAIVAPDRSAGLV